MSTVPSTSDIVQAKKDMDDINKFTLSPQPTFTDNTGVSRLTLQGITEQAQNAAGFQARQVQLFSSIKNLIVVDDAILTVKGFYAGSSYGGGDFYYDPNIPKTSHNGGTIIAPEALNAWNGEYSGLAAYLNWSGTGNGCFVRVPYGQELNLSWFGATKTLLSPESLNKCVSACNTSSSIIGYFDAATVAGNLYIGASFVGTKVVLQGTLNMNGFNITVECRYKRFEFDTILNTQTAESTLVIKDSYGCKINAVNIDGSNYPVKIFSNRGSGCFNNEISVYRTRSYGDTETSCWLITVEGGGFANENHLRAGFMTGQRGIYFRKGTGQSAKFDGNKIIAPMFELIDYRGIEFQWCNYNHMYDARYEASHTPSDSWIYERADCYQQQISGAQPIVSNKLVLLGEKTQYLAPLFSADGDNTVGFRFCSLMHWRGIGDNEGFGFSQVMGNSSPRGTIAFKKDLGAAPFTQYAFWIKDYDNNIIGAGEVDPYGFIETGENVTGDVTLANNISWIMCRPPTTSTATVSLIMPSSKQSEGREVTLYIPNTRYAQIEIKNAAGSVQLPTGTFDAEGIWKLFYRYARWRAYFVGNKVKM